RVQGRKFRALSLAPLTAPPFVSTPCNKESIHARFNSPLSVGSAFRSGRCPLALRPHSRGSRRAPSSFHHGVRSEPHARLSHSSACRLSRQSAGSADLGCAEEPGHLRPDLRQYAA